MRANLTNHPFFTYTKSGMMDLSNIPAPSPNSFNQNKKTFFSFFSKKVIITLFLIIVPLLAVFTTVEISKQQQETRSRAAPNSQEIIKFTTNTNCPNVDSCVATGSTVGVQINPPPLDILFPGVPTPTRKSDFGSPIPIQPTATPPTAPTSTPVFRPITTPTWSLTPTPDARCPGISRTCSNPDTQYFDFSICRCNDQGQGSD